MLKVKKVYNNNVLLGEDENHLECILIGKGIGFGKKLDTEIDESEAEKKFVLESTEQSKRFNQLLYEIPVIHLELTNQIINEAQKKLNVEFNDCIYLGLTDHISYALERHKQGAVIRNALHFEVQKFYPKEYDAALAALELIKQYEGVDLREDEAGFIALHFVNAQQDSRKMKLTLSINETVEDILRIVQLYYKIQLDTKSINYNRFVTHLQYFIRRLSSRELINGSDDELYEQLRRKYSQSYACSCKVKDYLEKKFSVEINNEEMLYFTLHINRVVTRDLR